MIDLEKLVPMPKGVLGFDQQRFDALDMQAMRADTAKAVAKRCAEIACGARMLAKMRNSFGDGWCSASIQIEQAIAAEFGLDERKQGVLDPRQFTESQDGKAEQQAINSASRNLR